MKGLSAVVPVYNEEAGIRDTLLALQQALSVCVDRHELIVVDDGSTDGTSQILAQLEGIRVLENSTNKGYGAAIKRGVHAASFEWILITDGDRSYPASNLPKLLSALSSNDMLVGARPLSTIGNPALWNLVKRLCQAILSRILGRQIPDLNSGMRIFRRELAMQLEESLSDGFSYTSGLTIASLRTGRRMNFTPIEYVERQGRSKVRPLSFSLAFVRSVTNALRCSQRPDHESSA